MNALLIGKAGGIENRFRNAFPFLIAIIVERDEREFAEPRKGVEICQTQKAHEQIGTVPNERRPTVCAPPAEIASISFGS